MNMSTDDSITNPCLRSLANRYIRIPSWILGAFVFIVLGTVSSALAETHLKVASVYSIEGSVQIRRTGESTWTDVTTQGDLFVGDTVRSGTDGAVAFTFVDGTLVRLGRLSAITFKEVLPSGSPVVSQSSGKAYYFSRGARNEPEIQAPLVNAAIYGTELVVDVSKGATTIDVLHGSIKASNSTGTLALNAGERVTARPGAPLERAMLARSDTAVQWMIRFPFLLNSDDLVPVNDPACSEACASEVRAIIARVKHGGTLLSALSQSPPDFTKTDQGKLLRAIGLWRTGDAASARDAIDTISINAAPQIKALRSLVEGYEDVRNGDKPGAARALATAQALRPDLINSALLESYIAQTNGDADQAFTVAHAARVTHPDVPELFDREAELLLAREEPRKATALLSERSTTFGDSPTSITLQGFAAVQRKDFDEATKRFTRATELDSSLSLPYLGQALVRVRDRDYHEAKSLLSRAVHLDPSVASYRSYLGKLFFESEDTANALKEFDAAIALDPNDPSPYLYRSFAAIANNDPVAALKDVEHSIDLNNARAVYRSSVQLDRDLAVRGAGLARAFNELGFSDAARIEAIRSVTDDYANFSAHRLLADSYASVIDAEANLSEKRIADLLSPLSFNLFNSLGEVSTLNDYNALFDKKETRQAVKVDWNSNRDQIGGEILSTGRTDTTGYLFSYQPYYMSGSHHNAYFGENVFRGALQHELSEDDRLILDGTFRMRESEGSTNYDYSEDVRIGQARLGYNHRFDSSWRFLAQAEYGRDRERTSELLDRAVTAEIPGEQQTVDTSLATLESPKQIVERSSVTGQLLYSSKYLDSVTGLEGKYADTSRREYSPVVGFVEYPDMSVTGALTTSSSNSLHGGQAYEYLSLKVPRIANLTLGVSAAQIQQDLTEVAPFLQGDANHSAILPKFGLVTTPTRWLTTRAAYFETLGSKVVLEDLSSLEPTLVGGISQRYNDPVGTRSRNVGVGMDIKLPNRVYTGAQYLHRNIGESFGSVDDVVALNGDVISSLPSRSNGFVDNFRDSDTIRGYFSLVPSQSSSFVGEALSYLVRDTDPTDGSSIRTDRFRLGYRYFLGKHFSLNTQATYRDQSLSTADDPSGFWLFDAGVSYRFSEQRGRIFARVDNLLDRSFTYDQSVGLESPILEGRSVVIGVAYNFW